MPKFSANLSMLFTELDFLDRFAAARGEGFEAVEFLFPYDFTPEEVGRRVRDNGLAVSVFNLPPGDWQAGERGFAALPGREEEFRAAVANALPYARATGATRLHVMAGITGSLPAEQARACYVRNLRYAAGRFADADLEVLIEPINPRDMPGYFLSSTDQAVEILDEIGAPNVTLQFDVYHHQITRGDVTRYLERLLPRIGHVQIAGVPERHEPDTGELDYAHLFGVLDAIGYAGWVGCEYRPRGDTREGLAWREKLA